MWLEYVFVPFLSCVRVFCLFIHVWGGGGLFTDYHDSLLFLVARCALLGLRAVQGDAQALRAGLAHAVTEARMGFAAAAGVDGSVRNIILGNE